MADINCVMWNCSGMLSTSSANEKINFLKQSAPSPFDILLLVETHHKMIEEVSVLYMFSQNYHVLHSEVDINDGVLMGKYTILG